MKKVLATLVILLSLIALSGCKWQIALPRTFAPGPGNTYDVNVSVGPDGQKHYFYTEELMGGILLTYTKSYSGSFPTGHHYTGDDTGGPEDPIYRYPDSAVTDDGTVYYVWHYQDDWGSYTDCWNHIHANGAYDDLLCHPLYTPEFYTTPTLTHPKVVAYKNVVFAVYERMVSGDRSLWYQQLNPLNASYGIVTNTGGGSSMDPSLAVSEYLDEDVTKYTLHVAWTSESGGASSHTVYNDNYGLTGDMVHQKISSETGVRSNPVIVTTVGANKKVFITYRLGNSGESGDLRLMFCPLPDCPLMSYVIGGLLDPAEDYWLVGKPDMAVLPDDTIMISFLGINDVTWVTTENPEVFNLTYEFGDSIPVTPTRITVNDDQESDPRLALTMPGITIAWRLNPSPGLYRDAYIVDNYTNSVRPVFISPADVMDGFFDIDARGEDIGGIFLDQRSLSQINYRPWFTMNVEPLFLPVIIRP
jgi:hypothetical protein